MAEQITLTIFLLRPDQVGAFETALLRPNGTLPLSPPLDGVFLPLPSETHTPRWVPMIRTILQQLDAFALDAQSPAGLLVVKRDPKMFVITFGHAWQLIDEQWIERDFGRRVALNVIQRDQLLEIRAEQVFAKFHLANERAPRASSVDEFNLEFDRDLVAAVTGVPSDKALGSSIRGATSLRLTIPLGELGPVLDTAALLFGSDRYRKIWPEIDNISPVTDQLLIEQLEAQLDADLTTPQTRKKIAMFTPAHRRDEILSVDAYVYGRLTRNTASTPYITIESWTNFLKRINTMPSVKEAKRSKIHLINDAGEELKDCTAFDCFGYETALNAKPYVLSSGMWYDVVAEFVSKTNRAVNAIPAGTAILPAWDHIEREGAYNERCAAATGYLHLDARNLHYGGGQSKFEYCDILDLTTKTLFFAKIPSKSSGMSHLIEQVRRTAELFFSTDNGYRRQLTKIFSKHHPKTPTNWLANRPRNGDWQLCLVSLGKPAKQLPFFAKCGLVRLYKELTERGHRVTYTAV